MNPDPGMEGGQGSRLDSIVPEPNSQRKLVSNPLRLMEYDQSVYNISITLKSRKSETCVTVWVRSGDKTGDYCCTGTYNRHLQCVLKVERTHTFAVPQSKDFTLHWSKVWNLAVTYMCTCMSTSTRAHDDIFIAEREGRAGDCQKAETGRIYQAYSKYTPSQFHNLRLHIALLSL